MADPADAGAGDLAGMRVVVTRAAPQAASLIEALEESGAVPVPLPLLELVDPLDGGAALGAAVSTLRSNDWLVVLSPNGARRIVRMPQPSASPYLAVIAGGTGRVFREAGWDIDMVPEIASSAGLLDAFESIEIDGRVLIAQAEHGRRELARGLADRGIDVEVVTAYRNIMPDLDPSVVAEASRADAVVFASPSAVERYVANVGHSPSVAVCIGSVTAASAIDAGFEVTTSAAPTVEALLSALANALVL